MAQSNNGWSPTLNGVNTGAVTFYKNTSTGGLTYLGGNYLDHALPSTDCSVLDFSFVECNGKMYALQADTYRFNSALGMTGFVYSVDYTGTYTVTKLAATTVPIGYSVSGEPLGTSIFIGAWWWVTKRFYIWEFDTLTNSITLKNNVLLPVTSALVRHLRVRSWRVGTKCYYTAYESNSATSTVLGNMKCFIVEYDTATTAIAITGFFPIYAIGTRDVRIFQNATRTYVFASTTASPVLIIGDVTNPYAITYFYYDSKSSGQIALYNLTAGVNTYNFLTITDSSNNAYTYDITDINNGNISYLNLRTWESEQTLGNSNNLTFIDENNVLYVTSWTQNSPPTNFIFYKYQSNFTPTTLVSTHYNDNLSLYLSSGTNGNCFCFMQDNNSAYTVVPSSTAINFTKTNAVDTAYFDTSFPFSFSSVPRMIESYYYNNYQYLFVGQENNCTILRCQDTSYNLIDLSSLVVINDENIYSFSGTGSYIGQIFPRSYPDGLYVLFTSINNSLKSYKLNESLVSFELQDTLNYTSFINYNGGFIHYYPTYNQTVLTTFSSNFFLPRLTAPGNALFQYSGNISNIDISDPTNMSFINFKFSAVIPQTPNSLTTFTYNNVFYCAVKYDASFSVNLQCFTQIYNFNDYLNFLDAGDAGITQPDYTRQDLLTSVVTSNSCTLINISNIGTGTNNIDASLTSNDFLAFLPYDGTSVFTNISNASINNNAAQLRVLYFNNKITLGIIQLNQTLYLYDITSPEFAASNQAITRITQVNTGSINFGSSFISKISQDGTPSYSAYLGSSLDNLTIATNINCANTALDKTGKFLYTCGSWGNAFQYFNPPLYGTTGSYVLSTKLVRPLTLNNGFLLQLNTIDGTLNWVLPFVGTQDDFLYKVQYGSSDDTVYVCGFTSSPSCFVYEKQSGLSSTFPVNIQTIFNSTSFGSGFLLQFSSGGVIKFKTLIYTDEPLLYVSATDIYVDTDRVVLSGKTNASTVECIDGLNVNAQTLYSSINNSTEGNIFLYNFSLAGSYVLSNIVKSPVGLVTVNDIKMYKSYDITYLIGGLVSNIDSGLVSVYQKDGSLATTIPVSDNDYSFISFVFTYEYDSTFYDTNNNRFSRVIWVNPSPFPFTDDLYQNYKLFIQGQPSDTTLNKNFSIRQNSLIDGVYTYILNEYIDVSKINRKLESINGITGSENYFHSSLSSSSLASVIHISSINTGTNTFICDSVSPALDPAKTYYILFPSTGASDGTKKVLITNITISPFFTFIQVADINECKVNGIFIGPFIYVGQLNPSIYYNLQFFPASINTAVYYYFKITSITLPNRPLINISNLYGGVRGFNDLPYLYMSIYNEDENGNYDDSIVNVVYDNNATRIMPFPQYIIPLSQTSATANFATFTTPLTPIIKFSPNFFRIRFKLMDQYGNILVFDPSATKATDASFYGGIVPDYFTNIYLRIEAKAV